MPDPKAGPIAQRIRQLYASGELAQRLADQQADILVRRFVHGEKIVDIGTAVGVGKSTVSRTVYVALAHLGLDGGRAPQYHHCARNPVKRPKQPQQSQQPAWRPDPHCQSCRYWLPLSDVSNSSRACLYILVRRHSRPRDDEQCLAYEPREEDTHNG